MHPEYDFTSHYAPIGDHRLHYVDEGEGPVIVAVHGNPTWSFYYRKVIKHLRTNFRVIVPDHMGCGLSDKPQDYRYTLENHINNLTELLDLLNIQKCSLLVHDWGGAIGMGYAVRQPGAIERLAVLNTAAFRSRRIPFRIRICRWPVLGEILVRGLNGFVRAATYMAVSKPMDAETRRCYLHPYDSWENRIAIHRFVRDIPLTSKDPSYSLLVEIESGLQHLRELNIPMLLLWGGKDFCFTTDFFREWQRRFPHAEAHLFQDMGHYLLEDGYEIIEPYLTTFFKRS